MAKESPEASANCRKHRSEVEHSLVEAVGDFQHSRNTSQTAREGKSATHLLLILALSRIARAVS